MAASTKQPVVLGRAAGTHSVAESGRGFARDSIASRNFAYEVAHAVCDLITNAVRHGVREARLDPRVDSGEVAVGGHSFDGQQATPTPAR